MTIYLKNNSATFHYEIIEKYEAGISLLGNEVKSVKAKHGSLKESYIISENDELFLIKSHIPVYQPGNAPITYDPYRKRKLLLSKKEIRELARKKQGANLTIIPLIMYNKNDKVKLEIALVHGKQKHDKRESIKKRDIERDIGRRLKG